MSWYCGIVHQSIHCVGSNRFSILYVLCSKVRTSAPQHCGFPSIFSFVKKYLCYQQVRNEEFFSLVAENWNKRLNELFEPLFTLYHLIL